jgi:hypothetical protein
MEALTYEVVGGFLMFKLERVKEKEVLARSVPEVKDLITIELESERAEHRVEESMLVPVIVHVRVDTV